MCRRFNIQVLFYFLYNTIVSLWFQSNINERFIYFITFSKKIIFVPFLTNCISSKLHMIVRTVLFDLLVVWWFSLNPLVFLKKKVIDWEMQMNLVSF